MHLKRLAVFLIRILGLVLGVIIFIVACIFIFFSITDGGCVNKVYHSASSPDNVYKIMLFDRDCGATTGYSTHISILKINEELNDGGNVFIADDDRGRAVSHSEYKSLINISVRWVDNSTVQVKYDKNARIFKEKDKVGDIRIEYSKM